MEEVFVIVLKGRQTKEGEERVQAKKSGFCVQERRTVVVSVQPNTLISTRFIRARVAERSIERFFRFFTARGVKYQNSKHS